MEYMYTSYMEKQMNNNFSAIQESITSSQITDSSFLHQLHNRFLILNSFFYSRISRSIDVLSIISYLFIRFQIKKKLLHY